METILIDLSEEFDRLIYNLLLTTLNAHGFPANSIAYIKSYFLNRYLRTNINNDFITWQNMYNQDFVLGPKLSNIFSNDIF